MKHTRDAHAVTSLPQAPQDEAQRRVRHYAITMGIRMVCFLLMALVQPYGWWTWVFAVAAAVLPYLAVVSANAVSGGTGESVESPVQQLSSAEAPEPVDDDTSGVFTVHEKPTAQGRADG